MDYALAVQRIVEVAGTDFGPADSEDLAALAALGAPQSLLRFYRDFEPRGETEVGKVQLLSISDRAR